MKKQQEVKVRLELTQSWEELGVKYTRACLEQLKKRERRAALMQGPPPMGGTKDGKETA